MKQKLFDFMQGRYGNDQLNIFLFICGLVVTGVISLFLPPQYHYFRSIGMIFYLAALFRSLSRSCDKRRSENARFMELTRPWRLFIMKKMNQLQDKEHRYYNCPQCHRTLRVPKGRGKINISCPHCGKQFKKKT